MSHPSCKLIADFIESHLDTLIEACSTQTTADHSDLLKELAADWLKNLLASLHGEPYRSGEWATHFTNTTRTLGLSVSGALSLLDTFRFSLTDTWKQEKSDELEDQMCICIFEASEIFKNHLVEYYIQQIDEEVAAETRKQKATLEASANPMAVLDEQGMIEVANRELGRLLKTNAEPLVGTDFYGYCSEETAALLRETQRKKTSAQQPLTIEGNLNISDQEVKTRFNLRTVFDATGHQSGTVVCLLPEAPQETAPNEGIEYFEDHILPLFPFPVQVIDSNQQILYNSGALQALSLPGYTFTEPVCCFLKKHQRGATENWFCKHIFEAGHFHTEEIHLEYEGKSRWLLMLNLPLNDRNGTVVRMVTCVYDLTRRRQIQKQMESHLIQQQRSSLVSQIAVTVAHQLRNPLSVVLGFAEMMAKGLPPDQYAEAVNRILRNSIRCKDIVENLLDFGKGTPLERRPVDLEGLIKKSVRIRMTPAEDRLITWRFSEKPTPVACVPEQITQIVYSLLQNALKVAKERIVVTVEVKGDYVRLRIVDDGPGIPISDRDRVFEPFYTTYRNEGAVGLGLSLARAVASDYGGSLTISAPTADEPRGACLIFQLPLLDEDDISQHTSSVDSQSGLTKQAILIVDDNADVRDLLTATIYARGYHVDTASTGMDALEKMKQHQYDAIILDFLLFSPISGRHVYEEMGERYPELQERVIFITGDMLKYQTRLYLESTHRPVLEKPFLITDFFDELDKILS
ncbi:MAG: response regulator [Candidatus Hydrogenedens sp.]|nr:response regulator [Candidatus Hydrogenedens sp.]